MSCRFQSMVSGTGGRDWITGGATTTGPDATHSPTIFQNWGGGGRLGGGPAGGCGGLAGGHGGVQPGVTGGGLGLGFGSPS